MNSRIQILDLFKGVAIIAVILYHAGLFKYGYLGVEMFLVIGGYLITKSILRSYEKDSFFYFEYLCKRLVRLWPLALIITAISLFCGYFFMLPDAFKNTCETAIGTSTFTNNFVQFITAGNYWDTANDFKPLMHTWYLGVIFQFYVIYPFIFMICHRFGGNYIKASRIVLFVVFALSLALFVVPYYDTAFTFYLLPARMFEFAVGGILALSNINDKSKKSRPVFVTALLFLAVILLCINDDYDISKVRLLLTVALSASVILYSQMDSQNAEPRLQSPLLVRKGKAFFVAMGMASYSLYLWHQVILALYRYVINSELNVWSYSLTIGISLILGCLSYLFVEKSITSYTKNIKSHTFVVLGSCLLMTVVICAFSLKYYRTQGVVRDVPELEVCLSDPSTYSPQDYNSRISHLYNKTFPGNGKKNILVVGDSFARDWINVMLESDLSDVNIVYSEGIAKDLRKQISRADVIFVASNGPIDEYVDYLPAMLKKKFYRVGHKTFGRGIGCAYNYAKMHNDYSWTIPYRNNVVNADERIEFYGQYINLMDSIRNSDGSISVFTNDKKLISHDGIHLTRAGAKRYAELINVNELLNSNR